MPSRPPNIYNLIPGSARAPSPFLRDALGRSCNAGAQEVLVGVRGVRVGALHSCVLCRSPTPGVRTLGVCRRLTSVLCWHSLWVCAAARAKRRACREHCQPCWLWRFAIYGDATLLAAFEAWTVAGSTVGAAHRAAKCPFPNNWLKSGPGHRSCDGLDSIEIIDLPATLSLLTPTPRTRDDSSDPSLF